MCSILDRLNCRCLGELRCISYSLRCRIILGQTNAQSHELRRTFSNSLMQSPDARPRVRDRTA